MRPIYQILSQVVRDGQYTTDEMAERIDAMYAAGRITANQADELQADALTYADPDFFTPDMQEVASLRGALNILGVNGANEAPAMRVAMDIAAAALDDTQALTAMALYPAWGASAAYIAGQRVRHGENLYRCLLEHTSQADWAPGMAPSLWARIDDPAIEWPEWRQPEGAHDAYPLGAKVSHGGKRWVSNAEANVWEPGAEGVTQWDEAPPETPPETPDTSSETPQQ